MQEQKNPMKKIRIEKITLNIGVSEVNDAQVARDLLEELVSTDPVITKAREKSTFGTTEGRPLGAKVTLRGEEAREFLEKALEANENTLSESSFDGSSVSFGVDEYIDLPDMTYDPSIGIMGFDVSVTLERPGYRVKKRRISSDIGDEHKIDSEEAIEFMKNEFGVEVEE